jgi:hypothetical protein
MVSQMVKVSIEVCSGATRFRVSVRAESVRRAVELVEERFSGQDPRVSVPSVLEGLSAEHPALELAA